ncbi:nucleotidyltransferase domain-containing protein [Luteibacter aegosomaticola]|uniref:nucleotidyltransferase domain-containing protein n=1 Tax=Luteibacter aegosomaticola TaxID=2911538 RepID=UPI001FF8B781|nr:nucleotidyltransferase domain-containing protein [Luteibacter aegosomaticola]UPG91232.1 nucleotidyltransferase domain-containing protein [Luteibacter aegosomaticola]
MISNDVREEVARRLRRAEEEHDVKVLLAVESGSRAWGFASPNSDYDARFIYVHRPEWYLSVSLEEQRDVIEYPIVDEMDINGWDVRKALRLFRRSNPGFVEWIQSPIIYERSGPFHDEARALLGEVYSVERGTYHYRSMAKTNYRGYLRDELVPLKKYFYVLRPLLAVRWLERYGKPAPIEFETLRTVIDPGTSLQKAIDDLLAVKRESPEMGLSPRIPPIQSFIEDELERLEHTVPPHQVRLSGSKEDTALSSLFRRVLRDTWA